MQVIEKQQTGFVVYSIVLHCKYKEFAGYLQIFFNVFDEKISNSGANSRRWRRGAIIDTHN